MKYKGKEIEVGKYLSYSRYDGPLNIFYCPDCDYAYESPTEETICCSGKICDGENLIKINEE